MTTDYKNTELFCIIDGFCKHLLQKIYLKTIVESSVDVVKHLPCTLTLIQRNVLTLFYCFLHFTQLLS